jgi:putative PIN family toxin of toxin-antitoxin system
MKVVIDTNVVVSAVLRNRSPEAVIRFVVDHSECQWFATNEIIAEYVGVLRRPKFGLPTEVLVAWEEVFQRSLTLVEGVPELEFKRDPKDAKFLACAIFVQADYLISGDRDFSEAHKVSHTTVLSVAQFKALVCEKWSP